MEQPVGQPQPMPYKPGTPDRRRRKPDVWARIFRYLTLLVYPLLVVFLFIFLGVASSDHNQVQMQQMFGVQPPAPSGDSHVDLYTLLPLLTAGLLIGAIGLVLNLKRGRRRSDYHYQTQMILVILSVVGLVVFFFLR